MMRALIQYILRFVQQFCRPLREASAPDSLAPAAPKKLAPLERIVLTDSVARTLFEDFASHKRGRRGEEEIGWMLLGVREEKEGIALATLPAGTQRSAGVAHVRFNSQAQAIASCIVRQWDRRVGILGVVHTHPGSLRHPSEGDYQGDSLWVPQLRGGEGIFGIGTADVDDPPSPYAKQPESHRNVLGELCFSWYALGNGDRRYRALPVHLTIGPDLARPLHPLWDVLEEHAEALERLFRQQARMTFEVLNRPHGKTLAVSLPLAEPESSVKVLLDGRETQYLVQQRGALSAVDPGEPRIDRAVYLILAELCGLKSKKTVARNSVKEKSHGLSTPQR